MSFSAENHTMRKLLPLIVAASALLGCAQQRPAPTPPPMVIDEAMQRRDFDRSVAHYPNGDTVAGVNRFPFRRRRPGGVNDYQGGAVDIVVSMAETVALPFTYLFIPPFEPQVSHGEDIPPTYTAMPPMHGPRQPVNAGGVPVNPDTLEPVTAPNPDVSPAAPDR